MDPSTASALQPESSILAGIQCDSSEVVPDDPSDSSAGTDFGLTKSQSWLIASLREAVQYDAAHLALVSITLETSETVSRGFVHPSRRNSPTLTKVQSDHYEVVADLVQTSFLFSIPMDGPMSFSIPHVSVQWSLRFEFFTTPKNVDWTRYEHPLLIEGRDKSERVLPITVHAPPPGTSGAHTRSEKPFSLEPLWVHN
ncbi:hypothetical protein FH972_026179 [Carpinus fangiana]|uniref:Uncharacterized protein n=1 Tax=Carpinus fangiana TaxID=176857 RepID=A0A5N6L396_9ROSI|nr:hypothetical protein FH972_026179 [Carpinus fangiana]